MIFRMVDHTITDDQLCDDHDVISGAGTVVTCVGSRYKTTVIQNRSGCGQFVFSRFQLHRACTNG